MRCPADGGKVMRVIDAHAHIFPDKIAIKASESIGDFYNLPMYSDASSHSLLEKEEEIQSEKILVCSSALSPNQVVTINDFLTSECKKHDKFIGFGAMHKDYEDFDAELDRMKEMGLVGVKFHNDMQKYDIDDPKMYPIYQAMSDKGLKLLLHMGDERYDYSSPKRMAKIAREFPKLTILASHFGGYQRWDEAVQNPRMENVYYDTSSSLPFIDRNTAKRMIGHFGEDHFFFGTDFPMWDPKKELERFLDLNLGEEANEKILYKNFVRVFRLEEE